MLKKIVTLALVLVFICTMSNTSFGNPGKIKLASGTPVMLKLTEEVSSKTKSPNDTVNLEVSQDVVVDGKILIKTGTPATATVVSSEQKGMIGKGGKVQISLENTKAVDGQRIMLKAFVTKGGKEETLVAVAGGVICCPLLLLLSGAEAVVPVGTETKAYTEMDMMIEAQ
jgi:hypothetical protein